MTLATKENSRVSYTAQAGFGAFDKGLVLISGPLYDETEQLSRLTWYNSHFVMVSNQGWPQAAVEKTLLAYKHSLNESSQVFAGFHQS